jgi:hypothetical protein
MQPNLPSRAPAAPVLGNARTKTSTSANLPARPVVHCLITHSATIEGIMSSNSSPSSDYFFIHTIPLPTSYTFGQNYPALTTIFTPAAVCQGRWLLQKPEDLIGSTRAFSYSLAGTLTDPIYSSCQPLSFATSYSPGICPDGYTMVPTVSLREQTSASTTLKLWEGNCCPR